MSCVRLSYVKTLCFHLLASPVVVLLNRHAKISVTPLSLLVESYILDSGNSMLSSPRNSTPTLLHILAKCRQIFENSSTSALSTNFAIRQLLKIQLHFKFIATLPCSILVFTARSV